MEAITTGAQLLQLGEARTVVAGGVESMSRIPLLYNDAAVQQYVRLGRAKSWWQRVGAIVGFRPRHFKPIIAVQLALADPASGLIMGETAEALADALRLSPPQ